MVSILIVEDARGSRESIKDALYDPKYEVVGEAYDGVEALEKFKQLKPEIVLMDIVLPKIDGVTTIKKIMKLDSNAYIIAISALYKTEQINKVINAGAKDYLTKPFNIDELVEALEKGLRELKRKNKKIKK